jgi:type I restriction enzyme, S subunit
LLGEASGSPSEVGKPALWSGEIDGCAFQNTLLRVRALGQEPRYLLHYFKDVAASGGFAKRSRGVGISHLGREALASWEVPLPPIDEQRRIAAILDKADELRAKRRAALAQLDSLTQSIFLEMFGGRGRRWPLKTLGALGAEFRYGSSTKSGGVGWPCVRIPDVIGGKLSLDDLVRVPVNSQAEWCNRAGRESRR